MEIELIDFVHWVVVVPMGLLYVIIEEHLARGQDGLSSNYLSQVLNVSNTSIDNYIKKLKKAGFPVTICIC